MAYPTPAVTVTTAATFIPEIWSDEIIAAYKKNLVLANCVQALKDFFNIDRWQINEPIIHSDVIGKLLKVKGVQTITNLELVNIHDSNNGYSNVSYDIIGATRNGITYPSLDPAIFEVKFPDIDIEGRIATY